MKATGVLAGLPFTEATFRAIDRGKVDGAKVAALEQALAQRRQGSYPLFFDRDGHAIASYQIGNRDLVAVDRSFGQGEKVSILGTDPALNRVLINGQTIASADWGGDPEHPSSRTFNYLMLSPQLIGLAEVSSRVGDAKWREKAAQSAKSLYSTTRCH